jgi:hypothetical protein
MPTLMELVRAWDKAISATDRHAVKCRACNRRNPLFDVAPLIYDPYTPCSKANALHDEEVAARKAYQAAGGKLPVDRDWVRRVDAERAKASGVKPARRKAMRIAHARTA